MIESSELFARMWEMDEDQAMLRETLRDFVDERIVPRREELDRTAKYPRDLHDEIVEMGLLAMGMPEEAGGMDMGALEQAVVFEELGRGCTGLATGVGANLLGSDPILLYGTPEQKVEYLSKIASGSIGAYALTEPNAGTDAGGIGTIATLQEDGETYKLSGQKTYITNAGIASIYTIFALTDPKRGARGVSCFIAEIDPENPPAGIEFPPKFDKMGINASETREIIFDGFEVKKANIVGGKPGRGFLQAMGCFDMSRPMIGTIGVGLAQSAFDAALRYGHERIQFGQPIIRFSGLRQIFVDMWLRIAGARAMVIGGARKVHRKFHEGVKEDVTAWSAMAKLMGSEAGRVTYDALQTTGGYGYMNETPFPKMMRDHKILEIFEGTNQIQREQTGRQLIQQFQKHGTARPAEAEASLSKGAGQRRRVGRAVLASARPHHGADPQRQVGRWRGCSRRPAGSALDPRRDGRAGRVVALPVRSLRQWRRRPQALGARSRPGVCTRVAAAGRRSQRAAAARFAPGAAQRRGPAAR
jgi:alkylation response protein AidB-like acyl-CoA dehydrogenase